LTQTNDESTTLIRDCERKNLPLAAPAHGAGGGGRRVVEWVPPCGGYPPVAEAPNRLQSTRQAPAVPTLNCIMIQRASDGSATGEALDPKANATARQRYADLGRSASKKSRRTRRNVAARRMTDMEPYHGERFASMPKL